MHPRCAGTFGPWLKAFCCVLSRLLCTGTAGVKAFYTQKMPDVLVLKASTGVLKLTTIVARGESPKHITAMK